MTSSFFNKKYFLQRICFLLIIIVADHVSGHFLQYLYFSQKTGNKQNLNYSFADCKSDVIIFGSSRAQHHYDTKIFSDSLHMSCYNAGMDGGHSILLSYAQISVILKRYQPKLIIVEMSPEMVYHSVDYDKLKVLLPYVKKYPELDSLTTLITLLTLIILTNNPNNFNNPLNSPDNTNSINPNNSKNPYKYYIIITTLITLLNH